MTREARTVAALAHTVNRRRTLARMLIAIAGIFLLASLLPHTWLWVVRALVAAAGVTLIAAAIAQFKSYKKTSEQDYAQHLDAQFPQLEDSTSLLLDAAEATPMAALQREKIRETFASLEQGGQLDASLPRFPWRRVSTAWALTLVCALLVTVLRTDAIKVLTDSGENTITIEGGRVDLTPPTYVGAAPSTVNTLDFATFEDSKVGWQITLSSEASSVQLVFHDGETLALGAQTARRWDSPAWRARSSVYRVVVDNEDIANGVFRIEAQPDQSPRIRVSEPEQPIRVISPEQPDTLLALRFDATDDYGITNTQARVTLARGNGEQVRFREEAIDLEPQWSDNRRVAAVKHELDLVALGMEPGDELYVFAEVSDNRVPTPNVGTSQTFIVRWPGSEEISTATVATLAVPVLPEFFRSQRQIIIDTERLIAEQADVDEADFAERAQSLAIDQKLLRLRYGQYLGEEDDSGIGAATQTSTDGDAEEDSVDDHDHDHDHAGHTDDEATGFEAPLTGDAQSVIDLYAHMHDREEQATLFEPATRELLRRALAQMWDAELQLRLAQPDAALPYEYAALGFIKEVQQSSRVYLRRTGFRPTPIDEERRLSGELDDVDSRTIDNDPLSASQDRRLRMLLHALTQANTPASNELSDLTDIVRQRALSEPSWLAALSAMERLQRDDTCTDCRDELTRELWRQLDDVVPPPAAQTDTKHPVQRAYDARRNSSAGEKT